MNALPSLGPERVESAAAFTPLGQPTGRILTVEPDDDCRIAFLTDPAGLAVEQYKMLRRRLVSRHPDGGVLMITSTAQSEGKTLTATNLAWCLAEGKHSTCLVDLDFRAPGVSTALQCSFEQDGLEDVIKGERSLSDSICSVKNHSLSVLGIHNSVPLPAALLAADRLGPILAQLRASYQWVVLDMAPAVPMADVAEVLPHADGAVLVVRSDQTKAQAIAGALEILGSKLWGVVLNASPSVAGANYGYGYQRNRKR